MIKSKPEERREIIEEAAGVSTFRHRRDLTRKRLAQTREELGTVEKELREKRGRLGQLKNQAEQAKQVRDIQGELRQCRLEKARRNFFRLTEEVEKLKEKRKEAKKKYEEVKKRREQVNATQEEIRDRLNEIDSARKKVDSFRQPVLRFERQLSEEIGRLEVRCDSLQEQLHREKQSIRSARKNRREELEELTDKYRRLHRVRRRRQIRKTEAEHIQGREEKLRKRKRELENKLEAIRDRSLFQISEESEFKHWQQNLKEEARKLREQKLELEEKLRGTREAVREEKQAFFRAQQKYFDVSSHRQELNLQLQGIRQRIECVKQLAAGLKKQADEQRQQLEALRSKRQTLSEMYSQYEGFFRGVKSIMQAHQEGRFPEIVGVVANLINVPSQYSSALQIALGEEMQNIITRTRKATGKMIDYLKENSEGRVTFLPLDDVKPITPAESKRYAENEAVIGIASELVEFSSEIAPAVHYLLDRVLVVEDLPAAYRLWENIGEAEAASPVIVTPAGEKIESGGAITGGRRKDTGDELLTRGDRLEDMKENLKNIRDRVKKFEKKHSRTKEQLERLKEQENQVMNALQGVQAEVRDSYQRANNHRHEYETTVNNYQNLCLQMVDVIEKQLDNNINRRGGEEIASTIADREARRRKESKDYRRRLDFIDETLEGYQGRWREVESKVQSTASRQRELEGEISQGSRRRRKLLEEADEAQKQVAKLVRKMLEKERQRTEKSLARKLKQVEQETWDQMYQTYTEKRTDCEKQSQEISSRLQNCERNTEKAKAKLEKIENDLSNKKARYEEQVQLLEDELEVEPGEEELEQIETGPAAEFSHGELNSRIEKLKSELRDLRPVNMLADKEAQKLEEEVTEIANQKEDLEESCEKLEKVIRRLNDRARQQFREAFSEIQEYFQELVGELFGGGTGHLNLTEGSVLEAGVTLEIEPPGENLKTMSALSGGEKSLAALALLFALYERKSTPFCFLDEVDAPLDDDNVSQFVNMLHRYSEETQFVVITHDKITMQAASQLYGVTMEESGVTTVVNIDLDRADQYREQQEVGA